MIVCLLLAIGCGASRADEPVYDIEIPSMNAAEALNRFAEQTGAIMLFPYDLANAQQANAVSGRYTLLEGLDLLLQDTGLSGGLSDKRVVNISPAGSKQRSVGEGDMPEQSAPLRKRITALVASIFSDSAASGQEPDIETKPLEEIIVTARKRAEDVQDVPGTLDVFTREALAASGTTNSYDLQYSSPGLSIAQAGRETQVSIRGVTNNVRSVASDPSTAIHLDGVYLPRSAMALTELFDLERVEVLKGPQGTLYGRNATAGVINVISRAPQDEFGIEGFAGGGSDGLFRTHLAANIPLKSGAIRFSGAYADDDGYTKNLTGDNELDNIDIAALRTRLRLDLAEDTTLSLTLQHLVDNGGPGFGSSANPDLPNVYASEPQRLSPRRVRFGNVTRTDRRSTVGALTLDTELGTVGVRSITGAIIYDHLGFEDTDYTPTDLEQQDTGTKSSAVSQEIQLFNVDPDKLTWSSGLYLFHEDAEEFISFFVPGGPQLVLFTNEVKSTALGIYGEATYRFSDALAIVFGARYAYEEKEGRVAGDFGSVFGGPVVDMSTAVDFEGFTPKAQIQFFPTDGVMFYAGVTEGFKSGGINLQTPAAETFLPEKLLSYEGGVKTTLLDGRLTFNAAGFHYDYEDIQLRQAIITTTSATVLVTNAASADVTGIELAADFHLLDAWSVDFSGAYTNTELHDFVSPVSLLDVSGSALLLSPKRRAVAGVQFYDEIGKFGHLRVRAEYAHQSPILFAYNDLAIDRQSGYGLLNVSARLTPPNDRFYVEVIGRNLSDELYLGFRSTGDGYLTAESFGSPRSVEVRIGFDL